MFEFLNKKKTEPGQVASALSAGLGGKPKRNELTILTNDGDTIGISIAWDKPDRKGILLPWTDFYKWFFGRESYSYVLRWKDGETMIRREDIKRFTVQIVDAV